MRYFNIRCEGANSRLIAKSHNTHQAQLQPIQWHLPRSFKLSAFLHVCNVNGAVLHLARCFRCAACSKLYESSDECSSSYPFSLLIPLSKRTSKVTCSGKRVRWKSCMFVDANNRGKLLIFSSELLLQWYLTPPKQLFCSTRIDLLSPNK